MKYAEIRDIEFPYGANCAPPKDLAGGFVEGSLAATRQVVAAEALFRAYHECDEVPTDVEAYGTLYQYPAAEYGGYVRRTGSPKGYDGPAACCRLVWDVDRKDDLERAIRDTSRLVTFLLDRYGPHAENGLGVWFSGFKGFHVLLLAPPGFHAMPHVPDVVKLLCLGVAASAKVVVDGSIYDRQHLLRLPNTRHPRTKLFKRHLEPDELFALDAARVRDLARHPAGFPVPCITEASNQLSDDWCDIESHVTAARPASAPVGRVGTPSSLPVVPDYVRRFIGFGDIQDPGRAVTLFRCAAALAEAGTPAAVVCGLLEESAIKGGLGADEVEKQLAAGIEHGNRKGVSS